MRKRLSPRQQVAYDCICEHFYSKGRGPSLRQLAVAMGLSITEQNVVSQHVAALVRKRWVLLDRNASGKVISGSLRPMPAHLQEEIEQAEIDLDFDLPPGVHVQGPYVIVKMPDGPLTADEAECLGDACLVAADLARRAGGK